MALTIDLSDITIDVEAATGVIVDGSTYGSPARNTLGVFLKVYKVDKDGARTEETNTSNASDPESDSEWTFEYSTDGWRQIFYVAVPKWAATTYARYDAVYDAVNDIVYRSKVNANVVTVLANLSNTTNWEVISVPTSLALNVGTSTQSNNINTITGANIYNTVLYQTIQECFEEKTSEAFIEASSDYKRSQDVRVYELLGLAIDGIDIANEREEYSLGEIIARRAMSICDC